MDFFYLGILIFLLLLATFDLSVGVANDAVNFLSPAVGAKTARFRTILIVAAVGILVGASTSGGMMDIARHGVLNPHYYTLSDVMCVFLAVAATDVIVLDIFNTLGMPTSTTVSMVFGLLGGSSALAFSKIFTDGHTYAELINTDKALSVIIAIFLSVAIAFVFGFIVMWLTRIVFTFHYRKHLRYSIALFGGFSTTSIFYFLITSGLRSSTLLSQIGWTPQWVEDHRLTILGVCLVAFTVLTEILHLLKVNIFKMVTLFGTFALAMAFAGNDLVNFIGTPLAGLEAYLDFSKHPGADPSTYIVSVLAGESQLPGVHWMLALSGIIMTVAICTSKKAHKVVETTVNLSRQDEGDEVFSSSRIARRAVRTVLNTTHSLSRIVPGFIQRWVDKRFEHDDVVLPEGAAFDEVRASVNLVLGGLLIVIGTSLQLPLSTTYVAFMVAMGSSLADRAWGRESAVYRITGVITVIGGWFITAGAAFIISFTIATVNHWGGFVAMILVLCCVVAVIYNNNKRFKQKSASETVDTVFRQLVRSHDKAECWQLLLQHVRDTQNNVIDVARQSYGHIIDGLLNEHIRELRRASRDLSDEKAKLKRYRRKEIIGMRKIDSLIAVEKNTWFHMGCNGSAQIIYCLKRMLEPCAEHVDNNFSPMPKSYAEELLPISQQVDDFMKEAQRMIVTGDFKGVDEVLVDANALKSHVSQIRHEQQYRIQQDDANLKVALLYLSTLQETQELIAMTRHLLRASKRFQTQ